MFDGNCIVLYRSRGWWTCCRRSPAARSRDGIRQFSRNRCCTMRFRSEGVCLGSWLHFERDSWLEERERDELTPSIVTDLVAFSRQRALVQYYEDRPNAEPSVWGLRGLTGLWLLCSRYQILRPLPWSVSQVRYLLYCAEFSCSDSE